MHRLRILGIFAALALLIAACGGPTPPPQTTHTLTVTVNGDGSVHFDTAAGDVVPAESDFAAGTEVTLVAVDGADNFVEWGGACDGTDATCTVTMDGDKLVTATFETPSEPLPDTVPMTVAIEGTVGGTVTQAELGINCTYDGATASGECAADEMSTKEATTFIATPDTDMSVEWVGIEGCADGAPECAVTADDNPFTLTVRFFDPSSTEEITDSVAIANGADDGYQWVDPSNSGNVLHVPPNPYNDLEYSGMGYLKRYEAEVINGFIFRQLGIPAGATIIDAYIQFTSIDRGDPGDVRYAPGVGDPVLIISAEDSVDPAPIGHNESGANLSSRDTIGGDITWEDIPQWQNRGEAGEDQQADVTSLLQALVQLEGWDETGSAMFMIANGDADASDGYRQILTLEGGGAAVLHFTYTVP